MAGSIVEYVVALKDEASAALARLGLESAATKKAMRGLGEAVNAAEAAIGKAASATSGAVRGNERLTKSYRDAIGAAADKARADELYFKQAGRIEKLQQGMMDRHQARQELVKSGMIPGGRGGGKSLINGAMDAWAVWSLGSMAVTGVDSVVERAAAVATIREKLRMSLGGDTKAVEQAYKKAFELSGTYKNTSVAENLQIIDDLRANLPESMDKILKESTEPFVKLHGFLKAYEGGKHAGTATDALKEIGLAIRSGELAGNLTGEQIARYASGIAAARIQFGDKYKIGEVFAAQKSAAVAYNAADATFQQVYFPVLVQALGQRAGTGLSTLYNKLVGGIRVLQSSAEQWREIGMVDMANVKTDKNGRIDQKSLVGNNWLVGGDAIGKNIPDWIMGTLLPHLTGSVKGLNGQAFAQAWANKDTQALVGLTEGIDRASLSRKLAALGYDKTAIVEMEEMIFRAAAMSRDLAAMGKQVKEFEKFESYDKAKQSVGNQIDRLFLAATGENFIPLITGQLSAMADAIGWVANAVDKNPLLQNGIQYGAIAAGIAAAGMAVRGLWWGLKGLSSISGLTWLGGFVGRAVSFAFSATGLASIVTRVGLLRVAMLGLRALGPIGLAVTATIVGYEALKWVYDHFLDPKTKSAIDFNQGGRGRGANAAYLPHVDAAPEQSVPPGYVREFGKGGWHNRYVGNGVKAANDNVAGSQANKEIAVRTTLDPIKVNVPSSITLQGTLTGTGGVTANVNGSIPMSAVAPRGTTMSDTAGAKAAGAR